MSGPVRVAAQDLRQFVAALFAQAGMSAVHAAIVAEALVWANLRGVDTHGIARVPRYLEFIQTGIINPQPAMRVVTDTPAVLVLDADRAAGAVAMTEAADAAIKAKIDDMGGYVAPPLFFCGRQFLDGAGCKQGRMG